MKSIERVAPLKIDPALLEPENRLNEAEAAEYLKRSVQTLRNWRTLGRGPRYMKLAGSVQYLKSDLADFLVESFRTSTSDKHGDAAREPAEA
ncbi:MAG: helix-turn-helix domain-containing protein [Salinarimonas sp.]